VSLNTFTDQLGRLVYLSGLPKRIISLVPSHTELLFSLGLHQEIVGVTKFCTKPIDQVDLIPKVGGTKQVNLEKIAALAPDFIIANKEENTKGDIEWLMERFPVWISDIFTLEDALVMISETGKMVGKHSEAMALNNKIISGFDALLSLQNNVKKRVAYLIWKDPLMVSGKNTFIDHILTRAGFENAIDESRYPVLTEGQLREVAPDLIFLSSEPYPFKEKHMEDFRSICPHSKIILVDGEMFSWYGSRLQFTSSYIRSLLYPLVDN